MEESRCQRHDLQHVMGGISEGHSLLATAGNHSWCRGAAGLTEHASSALIVAHDAGKVTTSSCAGVTAASAG